MISLVGAMEMLAPPVIYSLSCAYFVVLGYNHGKKMCAVRIFLTGAREIRAPSVVYEKNNNEPIVYTRINPWGIIQQQEAGWAELFFLVALALTLATL